MPLYDLQIRKLKPRKERYEVSDGDGLAIRISPTGGKTVIFRYHFEGVPRRMTLGIYNPDLAKLDYYDSPIPIKVPFLTLTEARRLHAEARSKLARGIDPGAEKKKSLQMRTAAPTFREMLEEFSRIELSGKKTGDERRRLLEKDAVPAWGKHKVVDIKRRDIVLLLDRIRERAPITANRFQGVLARFFFFCAERGVVEDSPCTRIRKVPERARSRVLNDEEIKLLWRALDLNNKTIDIYVLTKLALRMLLVTGQRPGEVCGMTWGEIGEDGFWRLPQERAKNQEGHRIPLTNMATEILRTAQPYAGDCVYVFRSSYKADSPIDRHSLSRAISRHWKQIGLKEKFTPHDLRRTMRTRLAELGISDIVAERAMGHKLQGMMAIYNRYSYDQEKREALEKWEIRLQEIITNER